MMIKVAAFFPAAAIVSAAWSQQPIPERIIEVSGPVEGAIATQVEAYEGGARPEVLRQSDVLLYPYGIYQPVLVCTVLRACIVELERGESLISLIAGDDQRWLIDHTSTGPTAATPLVSVKPTDHDITTNLIISTDRRVYHLTLDSPPLGKKRGSFNPHGSYTRHIRFYYPEDHIRRIGDADAMRTAELSVTDQQVNYNYSWKRNRGFPWEPLVVFDDGNRVYIRVPEQIVEKDAPLLVVRRAGKNVVSSYVLERDFYIVAGLFDEAHLIGPTTRYGILRRKRPQVLIIHRTNR